MSSLAPEAPAVGEIPWFFYYQAEVYGVDGDTVVGHAWNGGHNVWNEFNCPFVLTFGGATVKVRDRDLSLGQESRIAAISGNQIVGNATWNAGGAWLGSISGPPYVSLHPSGWDYSYAMSVHSGRQVGHVAMHRGFPQAALWTGSAASFVNLNPEGWSGSEARATWGQVQGGVVIGSALCAALWTGTAASFTNLHPQGADHSHINGMYGAYQVGRAKNAYLWKGSADRSVSLHPWLDHTLFANTLEEAGSEAKAVWTDEANHLIRVVGSAWGPKIGNQSRAVLWTIQGDPTAPSVPLVATTNLTAATVGTAYSLTLAAKEGAPPYTWSLASGTLPTGLVLSPAGVLSGIPTATGLVSFRVQVKDSANATGTRDLSLRIHPPALRVVSTLLPDATARTAYNHSLIATGGVPPYGWTVTFGQPGSGIVLSSAGQLSGLPLVVGTNSFTVQVSDGAAANASTTLVLAVKPAPPLEVRVGGGVGLAGSEVVVPVSVTEFTGIAGIQFSLRWSPSVLTFAGLEQFGLGSMGVGNFNTNSARAGGTLGFSWEDAEGTGKSLPSGSTLFALRFRLSGAPGASDSALVTGDPVPMEAIDAQVNTVRIVSVSEPIRISRTVQISGVVRLPDGIRPVPGVQVDLTGDMTQSMTVGADGRWTFTVNPGGNYVVTPSKVAPTPAAAGISTADVLLIRRHVLGLSLLDSPHKVLAADASASASVTSADLVLLRRVILGIADSLPSGPWRFLRSGLAFTNPQAPWGAESNRVYRGIEISQTDQDFVAVRMGDVNQSWTTTAGTIGAGFALASAEPAVRVVAGDVSGGLGAVVEMPVSVGAFKGVTSLQFSLGWDPARLLFEGIGTFGVVGLNEGSFNASSSEGWLACAWDDPAASGVDLPDGGILFVARFRVMASDPDGVPVRFSDHPTVQEATVNLHPTRLTTLDGRVVASKPGVGLRLELRLIGEVPQITVHGEPKARVEIQSSAGFGAPWESRTELVLEAGLHVWLDERIPPGTQRLYRAALR